MPFGNVKLNDGNEFPTVAFGTGTALFNRDAVDAVTTALETGFSHIDTAQAYQNEISVGLALKESGLARSDVYVTTKYGGGDIQDAVRTSLQKLGLTHVDLYLIHQPRLVAGKVQTSWSEFEQIKKDGLAKSIGVSNFTVKDLQELIKTAKIKPAVNQIRFHPYNYSEHKALLEYSAKHGIVTEAYSSLTPITRDPGGPVDKPIKAAAERIGATPAQVVFLWVLSKGVAIVTTSSKVDRLKEYLAVADLPKLTNEEIEAIDAAGAQGPGSRLLKTHILTGLQVLLVVMALGALLHAKGVLDCL